MALTGCSTMERSFGKGNDQWTQLLITDLPQDPGRTHRETELEMGSNPPSPTTEKRLSAGKGMAMRTTNRIQYLNCRRGKKRGAFGVKNLLPQDCFQAGSID